MTASFFPRALLLLIVGSLIACSTPRKGDIPMADKVPPLPTGMVQTLNKNQNTAMRIMNKLLYI